MLVVPGLKMNECNSISQINFQMEFCKCVYISALFYLWSRLECARGLTILTTEIWRICMVWYLVFGIIHTYSIATSRWDFSGPMKQRNEMNLRTVPTIVIAHTFCASPDTRISFRRCLLKQGYFCAV